MFKQVELKTYEEVITDAHEHLKPGDVMQVAIREGNDYVKTRLKFIKYFSRIKTFLCEVTFADKDLDVEAGDRILVAHNQIREARKGQ